MIPEFNLKLHMTLSDDCEYFELYVNGEKFFDLPFKYDLTPEGDVNVKLNAIVIFNGQNIAIPQPWNNREFNKNLREIIEGDDKSIKKVEVSISESSSSAPINEIYDTFV